jgi:hypothetical protein
MKIECKCKSTGETTMTLGFDVPPNDVKAVMSSYAFKEPHDVYVDDVLAFEWTAPEGFVPPPDPEDSVRPITQ